MYPFEDNWALNNLISSSSFCSAILFVNLQCQKMKKVYVAWIVETVFICAA